jgi:predicted CopG family antitoxin
MTAIATWPGRAEMWLDERGKAAWIAAMVLGFILFWPVGLAILAYMIWGKQMFRGTRTSCGWKSGTYRHDMRPSGNTAFDAYKSETLKRLEEEQAAFEDFLRRLREAKDKTEFDAFMDERARRRQGEAQAEV